MGTCRGYWVKPRGAPAFGPQNRAEQNKLPKMSNQSHGKRINYHVADIRLRKNIYYHKKNNTEIHRPV
jgi:hypothetical protein